MSVRQSSHTVSSLNKIRSDLEPVLREAGATKAIEFGSYALNTADEYSDLDLIIVAESDRRFLDRHEDFSGVNDVWRRGLDLLIYTSAELEEMVAGQNPFIERTLEEGVVIYEK